MGSEKIMIEPYNKRYKTGVINCLRRNFQKLNNMSRTDLNEWFDKIAECDWSESNNPYKHGYVILYSCDVVGYCGVILSDLLIGEKKYIYANVTTWGIDERFRFYLFEVLTDLIERVDVISDFTPNRAIEKISMSMYGFKKIDSMAYKFKHDRAHIIFETNYKINEMSSDLIMNVEYISKYFEDHKKYGIKGLIIDNNDNTFILYYLSSRNPEWVNVVYVSNVIVFTNCIGLVIKKIYEMHGRGLICDSNFINLQYLREDSFETAERCRLIWSNGNNVVIPGLLYSELPLLRL